MWDASPWGSVQSAVRSVTERIANGECIDPAAYSSDISLFTSKMSGSVAVESRWLWKKPIHPSKEDVKEIHPSIHPIVSGSWVNCQDGSILHPSSLIHWHLAERNFDQSFAKMLWNPSPGGFPASDVVAAESDVTAANLISFAYGNHFKVGLGLIVWWKTWTWKVWSFWSFCPFQIGVLWTSEYLVHQSLYKFVVGKGAEIAKFSGTQIL